MTDQPQKILNYYFEHQKQDKKPINEAKMLIVGQGAVGKTSLVRRLVNDEFNPHESKTDGIDINPWHVPYNDRQIRLNLWDFGGQEIMHATHQFFLTKRSLYILVLDSRVDEQENRLEYWLKIINSFGGGSPIIIVCNKSDEHSLDLNWRGIQEKYPSVKAFAKNVSCKTGEGIPELKNLIENKVSRLEHISDELILSWFSVKEHLETSEKDYISYREYSEICRENSVSDDLSQQTLIGFLHDLGVVLHFQNHPVLEDTNVLNPEWVTKGVYRILNSHILFQNKGELDRKDLEQILDPQVYPRNRHQFIIDMMRNFELCFDFEGFGGQKFLVPDLLSKEEPDTGDWSDSLAFRYHYDVLPGSIISRFIVRMHAYISKRTFWRNGTVLVSDDGRNRALVKADTEDRKILISVTGNPQSRRTFLAVIRADFRKIHATIPKISVREKVPVPKAPHVVVDYQHLLRLEEKNMRYYLPEGLDEEIDVAELLNGVEPVEHRRTDDGNRATCIHYGDKINISSGGDASFAKDRGKSLINRPEIIIKEIERVIHHSRADGEDREDAEDNLIKIEKELNKNNPNPKRLNRFWNRIIDVVPEAEGKVSWDKVINS
ncbi:MAG: COR domain-containing protein [Desulfococcaceae bacterium]|nr:COR domain-containing protein [Desulfococcaceae bacterium]